MRSMRFVHRNGLLAGTRSATSIAGWRRKRRTEAIDKQYFHRESEFPVDPEIDPPCRHEGGTLPRERRREAPSDNAEDAIATPCGSWA